MDFQAILRSISSALPATIAVAVAIFIVKEILEFFRRRAERERKLGAVKTLLSEEIEKNHWAFTSMFRILAEIDEYSELYPSAEYSLVVARNGSEHYRVRREAEDESEHGQAIPKFHDEQYKKLLTTLAELSPAIFQTVNVTYSELAELAHFRETLIDFLASDEWFVERDMNRSFLRHLYGRKADYFGYLNQAYVALAGAQLKAWRLR